MSEKNLAGSQMIKKKTLQNIHSEQSSPGKDQDNSSLNSPLRFSFSSKKLKDSLNSTKKEKIKYSYECLNFINLSKYIYEGTEEVEIELTIKNNGPNWPKNSAKLKFELNSEIFGDEVVLESQKNDEVRKYEVKLKKLGNLKEGEYRAYLRFNINGEKIGEELILTVKIKKKEDPDAEIKKYIEQIDEFREQFCLSHDDYSNEKLLEALKENDFDHGQTFASLFG
jgi:hypothetical protein